MSGTESKCWCLECVPRVGGGISLSVLGDEGQRGRELHPSSDGVLCFGGTSLGCQGAWNGKRNEKTHLNGEKRGFSLGLLCYPFILTSLAFTDLVVNSAV